MDDKLRDHGDWKSYEDFFDGFVQAVGPDGVATVVELAVEETAFHEDRWHVCGRRKGREDIVHEEEVGNVLCGVGGVRGFFALFPIHGGHDDGEDDVTDDASAHKIFVAIVAPCAVFEQSFCGIEGVYRFVFWDAFDGIFVFIVRLCC